jgi:hypothetical protein
MQINVVITAENDNTFTMTPEECGAAILTALGRDPENDLCIVTLSWKAEQGSAGVRPSSSPIPMPMMGPMP